MTLEKPKNESSPPKKLADPEHRGCVYKLENNFEVNEETQTGQITHWKIFRPRTYMYLHKLAAFLANVSVCVFNKICLTLSRESGIFGADKRRRFHRLISEGEYFYGTPLQGQEFC